MRTLALIVTLASCFGLGACSKEHGDLIDSLPVNPEITALTPQGDPVDRIALEWDYPQDADVDEYRIYMGIYVSLGGPAFDEAVQVGTTSDQTFTYVDADLGAQDESLCDFGLCEPVYKYTYFRVSAVIDGQEGTAGWRAFAGD